MLSSSQRKLVKTISIERYKKAKKLNISMAERPDYSELKIGEVSQRDAEDRTKHSRSEALLPSATFRSSLPRFFDLQSEYNEAVGPGSYNHDLRQVMQADRDKSRSELISRNKGRLANSAAIQINRFIDIKS